ncbi:MAG: LPS export ABC transporter ATP-binding protein [Beijerinckiaceae bacterium]
MSILANMSNRGSAAARVVRGLLGRGGTGNEDPAPDARYDAASHDPQGAYGYDGQGAPEFYVDHYGEGSLGAYHLGKSYRGRQVVRNVSLAVRRGEAVGLLGPNGAGKTTVFYMITGLVKPDKGVIELDGHDVTALPMYRRARLGIGYLPQEASIFRGLNVEDNIRAVLEVAIRDKDAREAELEALLDEFDIKRLRKSPSIALSGGERRRCEIARALASQPSFMLLDEPFAGIDPIAVGDIQQLVRHLTQRGIGVLITDHNVRETLGLIDRAYIIHSGQVLTEGAPEAIVADPDVRRYYLGEDFRM